MSVFMMQAHPPDLLLRRCCCCWDRSIFLNRADSLPWPPAPYAALTPLLLPYRCFNLCALPFSLNPGVDRLAFSVVWDMDQEANIL